MARKIKAFINTMSLIVNVCIFMRLSAADPHTNFVWNYCGKSKYTNCSAFPSHLNQVMDSLVTSVHPSGYNVSSIPLEDNRCSVYGLVQCRGDLKPSDCQQCASTAKSGLLLGCDNDEPGFIQLEGCFLRYDNFQFYSGEFKSHPVKVYCSPTNRSRPQLSPLDVRSMLFNITVKATQNPALFAADSVPGPSSLTETVYSMAQCWKDLSSANCGLCLTYALANILSCPTGTPGALSGLSSCFLRYDVDDFLDISVHPQRPAGSEGKRSKVLGIALGLVAATVGLIASIGIWKWNFFSHLKCWEQNSGTRGHERGEFTSSPMIANPELIMNYDTVREATSDFRTENKLGEGGFGSVFKGILPDGREVAVKRLRIGSKQGDVEFLNEANLINRIQHRNLVKLLGCSVERSERLLIYEYLRNSSLDQILFDTTKQHSLHWKRRYEIIVGIARGLAYLHEESDIRIIHRDIKASNILLDHKYRAKIADFGLAKFFAEDQSHVSTRVAGTLGYMAPEYALRGQLTEKADVFSFGVLVLEIISGRKNQSLAQDMEFLIEGAWKRRGSYHRQSAMNLTITAGDGSRVRPHSAPLLLLPYQHVASGHGVTCIWYVGFVSNFPQNICKHRRNWGTKSNGSINVVSLVQREERSPKLNVFRSKGSPQSEMQFTQPNYQSDLRCVAIPDFRDSIPKSPSLGGNPGHEYEYDDSSEEFNEAQDNKVLKVLSRAGKLAKAVRHLEKMAERNHIPDVKACTRLIRGLCKVSRITKASRVLELLLRLGCVPDALSYSLVIARMCKMGHLQRITAYRHLDEICERGYPHLEVIYNAVLRTLCKQGELKHALEVMNRLFQKGLLPNVTTYSIIVVATFREYGADRALELFDDMMNMGCVPNLITYNLMINGICKEGRLDMAFKFLHDMQSKGCQPDVISYNTLLQGLCAEGRWGEAEKVLSDMRDRGFAPNVVSYNILIHFLCQEGRLAQAIDVLEEMPRKGLTPDALSYNPIIDTFCKEGRMDQAIEYLDKMVSRGGLPDIVTYNTMLAALCRDGRADQALYILRQLDQKGLRPVLVTYNTVIDGLSKNGNIKQALELLDEMTRKGLTPDVITYSSLVGGLCKEGMVDKAVAFLNEMEDRGCKPNVVTYNALILGLCKRHNIDQAINILSKMVAEGCKPNERTYTTLIQGIACEGRINEAQELTNELVTRGVIVARSLECIMRESQQK